MSAGGGPVNRERAGRAALSHRVRELAQQEGFELAGIASAEPSSHGAFLREWIAQERHGDMEWMARPDALERREDLRLTFPEVRSVLVVGHGYFQPDPEGMPADPSRGVVARYARGRDYHRVVKKKLQRVHGRLEAELDREVAARAYTDTGPVLERDLARRAGLGWFGRNTMLIDARRGSYFFLGALLLELDLEPDEAFEADHCGSCHACLDACPTGALMGRTDEGAPLMDARRCISYLTIEHRGPIPRELRPAIGNRVYGCDICQEVCPFNAKFAERAAEPGYAARGPGERPVGVEALLEADAVRRGRSSSCARRSRGGRWQRDARPPAQPLGSAESRGGSRADAGALPNGDGSAETSPRFRTRGEGEGDGPAHPGTDSPPLIELLEMALSEDAWESFSRGSAIRRARRAGFARNVCVGLGNWGSPDAVPVLTSALADPEPLVRGHAAWALGRVGSAEAREALASHSSVESDEWVRSELAAALAP